MVAWLAAEIPTLDNGGVAQDLMSITWRLRDDVQWSDGTPFTAEDVAFTADIAQAIITESALSFLGLGIPPPSPEWGTMIQDGRQFIALSWWMAFFPGVALAVTVFATNLLGDGLRDVLDPRSKGEPIR